MSTTTTLQPGQVVWTKGGKYGDDATGGLVIRQGHDPATGEATVTVLTYQAAKPRQASVRLVDRRGGSRDLGLVARLIRVPMSDIRTPIDDRRDWAKCWLYAKKAFIAAGLPPCDDIESNRHLEMLHAGCILRNEAVALRAPA